MRIAPVATGIVPPWLNPGPIPKTPSMVDPSKPIGIKPDPDTPRIFL